MIARSPAMYFALILLLLLAALNFLAFQYFWYWRLWWFDLLMHFLGGLAIGLGVNLAYFSRFSAGRPAKESIDLIFSFGLAMTAALMIGAGWELFELSVDQYWAAHINLKDFRVLQNDLADSWSDILFDVIGAATAVLLILFYPPIIMKNQDDKS